MRAVWNRTPNGLNTMVVVIDDTSLRLLTEPEGGWVVLAEDTELIAFGAEQTERLAMQAAMTAAVHNA